MSTPKERQLPLAEVPLDFPREWLDILDPGNTEHLISVDLTWLLSSWHCVFGTSACHGIDASQPDAGCCTHGAFLCDEDDRQRLATHVSQLTDTDWEHRQDAISAAEEENSVIEPWLEEDELDDELAFKTRRVNGACVFHNSPQWPGGQGCALHHLAIRANIPMTQAKPDVCWQLPLRRTHEWEERPDGVEILHTRIGEYDRRGWGGGEDFDWYCTGSPEAHTSTVPVFESLAEELVELLGSDVYKVIADACRRRSALGLIAVHPASGQACKNRS